MTDGWAWLFAICKKREVRVWMQPPNPDKYTRIGPPVVGHVIGVKLTGAREWLEVETPGEHATERVFLEVNYIKSIEVIRPVQDDETPASVGSSNTPEGETK